MRLCRFDDNRLGLVRDGAVHDVSDALQVLPEARWPLPSADLLIANLARVREAAARLSDTAPVLPLDGITLLSPVANPPKIIGAPVNYHAHLEESQRDAGISFGRDVKTIETYGLFLKASSSLVGPGEGVALRFTDRRNDHEAELAVVIGDGGSNIAESDAMDHVAGYAIGLDMTVRGTEDRSLRKSIDSYAVLGPWLVTPDEVADPDDLDFVLRVNGDVRQQSNTRMLIFGVAKLIAYASAFYTLCPGDVIMTGTPEGVGPVVAGDTMEVEIESIGRMTVAVRNA